MHFTVLVNTRTIAQGAKGRRNKCFSAAKSPAVLSRLCKKLQQSDQTSLLNEAIFSFKPGLLRSKRGACVAR